MESIHQNRLIFILFVSLVLFLPAVLTIPPFWLRIWALALFYATLAMAWNLAALSGRISLGHAAFFGLGAYTSALLNLHWGMSPWFAVVVGGLVGSFSGSMVMFIFRRLGEASFALATLAFMHVPKVIVDNWDGLTMGSMGIVGISPLPHLKVGAWHVDVGATPLGLYRLFALVAFMVLGIHWFAMHSRWGWAVRAVREDERAAASLGISIQGVRIQAFTASATITALSGGLYAHIMGIVEPSMVFSLHFSALPLVLTMLGGRFHVLGPLLGTLVLYPTDQILFLPLFPAGHEAIYGLVILVVMLFMPRGVGDWVDRCLQ